MMRLVFTCLSFLVVVTAAAQSLLGFPPGTFSGKAARDGSPPISYVGPGDVVAGASLWYSCERAYNAAYATGSNSGCQLTRTSDSATCDLLIASNGRVGLTANCGNSSDNGKTEAAWCTATTCKVSIAYNQGSAGSAGNVSSPTSGPLFTGSCTGSLSCMAFSGSSRLDLGSSFAFGSQPITLSAVSERTASFTSRQEIVIVDSGTAQFYFTSNANEIALECGTAVPVSPFSDSAFHGINAVCNGASSAINVDGTDSGAVNAGSTTPGTNLFTLGFFSGLSLTGNIGEAGVWLSGLNATQRGQICGNQRAYWGFSGTC